MTALLAPASSPLEIRISRRAILGSGAVALLLVSRPTRIVQRLLQDAPVAAQPAIPTWTLPEFLPHIGSTFEVLATSGVTASLVLVDAAAATSSTKGQQPASGEAIALLFEGPTGSVLSAETYVLRHAELGDRALFLSPVGRGLSAQDYQVVIDQRVFMPGFGPEKAG